jgi:hypothetical protein
MNEELKDEGWLMVVVVVVVWLLAVGCWLLVVIFVVGSRNVGTSWLSTFVSFRSSVELLTVELALCNLPG